MSKYYEWEVFKNIYLEDSFVVDIEEFESHICFTVEMVLTKEHPQYSLPKEGEQYCYKKGYIVFQELRMVNWLHKYMQPFTDGENSEDFGNIDCFFLSPEGYHLLGDWGEMIINSAPPKVVFFDNIM